MQATSGPESPDAIATELSLAAILQKRGEFQKALPLLVRSLELGREHQDLAAAGPVNSFVSGGN
jgi:hypothetical protein